ncbi:hypothetical protein LZC95_07780 [Pendulispora brunnea]|uniref:DUF6602 domain-containing protein n=1 Tax=Pendulispora brunnea TaxID=2905690 RepID=A0ABZ2KDR7_9BACT
MAHPRLIRFFNGAVDELRGAYTKSEGSPTACMGSLREEGIRRAIEHSLPSVARLYSGEIIDPYGGQSGQLDGIVVHATGSALATAPNDVRIALAEGVLAILESKSDIGGQWDEILRTLAKVRALRRHDGAPQGGIMVGQADESAEVHIPFIVMGRTGWKMPDTLRDKAVELFKTFGAAKEAALVALVQLEPAGLGLVWREPPPPPKPAQFKLDGFRLVPEETPELAPPVVQGQGWIFEETDRWRTLAWVWATLTQSAHRVLLAPPNWPAYFQGHGDVGEKSNEKSPETGETKTSGKRAKTGETRAKRKARKARASR